MKLSTFNQMSMPERIKALRHCCPSDQWIQGLSLDQPFRSEEELLQRAVYSWYEHCDPDEWMKVIDSHPQIGDQKGVEILSGQEGQWSLQEQKSALKADKEFLTLMKELNAKYLDRFGFIYVISAQGKDAFFLHEMIQKRLLHDKCEEIEIAANEIFKIAVNRLKKTIEIPSIVELTSQITTHILLLAEGQTADGVVVRLMRFESDRWKTISISKTDYDGRISDLMPPAVKLEQMRYKMVFDTAELSKFYPQIGVEFNILDSSHYHIPLLLSPFGYTTYRGS